MNETTLTLAALFTANLLFIWGLNACFDEGMIFGGIAEWFSREKENKFASDLIQNDQRVIRHYIEDGLSKEQIIASMSEQVTEHADMYLDSTKPRIPEWLQKPLYSCPVCQSSIWGTLGYFSGTLILFGWSWPILALWPVYVVCLAGISAIILQLSPEGE